MKGVPLWPSGERTASLDDIGEATGGSHVHGVNIHLVEEGSRKGNDRRNANLGGLSKLTLVASVDVPFDVVVDSGPPEVIEQGALSGVNTLVSEIVVGSVNDSESIRKGDEKLVTAVRIVLPKPSV